MRDTFLSFTYFSKNSQLNEIFDKEFNTLHFDFTPRGKKFEKTLPWLIPSDGGEKIFAYRVKNIYANPNVCIRLSAPRSIEQSSDHRSKKEEEKKWISPRDKRERIISLLERVLTRRSVETWKRGISILRWITSSRVTGSKRVVRKNKIGEERWRLIRFHLRSPTEPWDENVSSCIIVRNYCLRGTYVHYIPCAQFLPFFFYLSLDG